VLPSSPDYLERITSLLLEHNRVDCLGDPIVFRRIANKA
jgi:hypothetical protein